MLFLIDHHSPIPIVHALCTTHKESNHRKEFAWVVDEVARRNHHTLIVCLQWAHPRIDVAVKRLSLMRHLNAHRHRWETLIIVADTRDEERLKVAAAEHHLPYRYYPSWSALQTELQSIMNHAPSR